VCSFVSDVSFVGFFSFLIPFRVHLSPLGFTYRSLLADSLLSFLVSSVSDVSFVGFFSFLIPFRVHLSPLGFTYRSLLADSLLSFWVSFVSFTGLS